MANLLETLIIINSILIAICFIGIGLCIYTFIMMVLETRLPGRRLFGMNCDGCTGKFRGNGKPLYRCYIKKPLIKLLIRYGLITKVLNQPPSNNP
jgi:hypothetical protein